MLFSKYIFYYRAHSELVEELKRAQRYPSTGLHPSPKASEHTAGRARGEST